MDEKKAAWTLGKLSQSIVVVNGKGNKNKCGSYLAKCTIKLYFNDFIDLQRKTMQEQLRKERKVYAAFMDKAYDGID